MQKTVLKVLKRAIFFILHFVWKAHGVITLLTTALSIEFGLHSSIQGCRNPGGIGGYISPNNLTVSPSQ